MCFRAGSEYCGTSLRDRIGSIGVPRAQREALRIADQHIVRQNPALERARFRVLFGVPVKPSQWQSRGRREASCPHSSGPGGGSADALTATYCRDLGDEQGPCDEPLTRADDDVVPRRGLAASKRATPLALVEALVEGRRRRQAACQEHELTHVARLPHGLVLKRATLGCRHSTHEMPLSAATHSCNTLANFSPSVFQS